MSWVSHAALATLLGEAAAGMLCKSYGGVRYYVPAEPDAAHPFAPILGNDGMKALCLAYGGEKITVPNWKKPEPKIGEILNRLEKGDSPRDIAIALDVTERWVWAVAKGNRPVTRQLSLFGEANIQS